MNHNNSTSIQERQSESMSNEIAPKIADTRNVIMNKFKMTHMNRLEHEHELNQTMKHVNEARTNQIDERMQNDPNKLCIRLKLLIKSKNAGNMQHAHEINSIMAKLRELEIIV